MPASHIAAIPPPDSHTDSADGPMFEQDLGNNSPNASATKNRPNPDDDHMSIASDASFLSDSEFQDNSFGDIDLLIDVDSDLATAPLIATRDDHTTGDPSLATHTPPLDTQYKNPCDPAGGAIDY